MTDHGTEATGPVLVADGRARRALAPILELAEAVARAEPAILWVEILQSWRLDAPRDRMSGTRLSYRSDLAEPPLGGDAFAAAAYRLEHALRRRRDDLIWAATTLAGDDAGVRELSVEIAVRPGLRLVRRSGREDWRPLLLEDSAIARLEAARFRQGDAASLDGPRLEGIDDRWF